MKRVERIDAIFIFSLVTIIGFTDTNMILPTQNLLILFWACTHDYLCANRHFYLSELSNPDAYNASSKARIDAETIFERRGLARLPVESRPGVFRVKLLKPLQLFSYSRNSLALYDSLCDIPSGSVIFVQYPLANNTFFANRIIRHYQKHGLKFVALIHDYDSFRYTEAEQGRHVYRRAVFNDTKVLPLFDSIISHNASMTKILVESGIEKSKIVDLVLFDHLTDVEPVGNRHSKNMKVDFAGNLSDSKSAFLYSLPKEIEKILNLYGNGLSEEKHCGAKYYGPFVAEKAALNLRGAFGLVWDGESADTCAGKFGDYLRINNPLKLSMYLSCGMPVIVWKDSALANFVKRNRLGFTIAALSEVPGLLNETTEDDYAEFRNQVSKVQKRVCSGLYLDDAITRTLEVLNEK